jgi:hypothetical protein
MTNPEFNSEFDILYDNLASKSAPGVNKFEKSVFLTKAQEEIVKELYQQFEFGENQRKDLAQIVLSHSTSVSTTNAAGISPYSKFFVIPTDTWYIINERVTISAPGECFDGETITVKPITHDEYNVSILNPFRKPDRNKAWRLDVSLGGGSKTVEIISKYTPTSYQMRYIKKPLPIILTDLSVDYPGYTIEGLTSQTECQLTTELHRNILNRAVEHAIGSYRENSLQAKVELNKRSV